MNGDARNERPHIDADADAASLGTDILNPFVHRLELGSTYDKLKVSTSRSRFLPEDRCLCGRVLGDAATATAIAAAPQGGMCFDRVAEKVRVSVLDKYFAVSIGAKDSCIYKERV